jgi:YbbR domain-containing protein
MFASSPSLRLASQSGWLDQNWLSNVRPAGASIAGWAVVLERAVEREVEVNPRVEGRPPDGYAVRQVTANPSRVRMVGPASELTRITRVRTLPISVTGQTASFSARALLEPVGRQVRVEDSVPIIVQVDIEERKS